jgi:small subunit ribosomal protein S1
MQNVENLIDQNEIEQTDENANLFAQLLDEHEPAQLQQGQYITGEIIQIKGNMILADVSAKRTAVIPPQDIAEIDENQLAQLAVGDKVPLYVLRSPVGNQDLLVSLNKGLEQQDWITAEAHLTNESLLELEVIGHNKGGLKVAYGHLHGFVPTSHIPQLQFTHNQDALTSQKAKLIGEALPLKIIEVDRDRQRLILSAKKAQKEVRKERLQALKDREGEIITGHVTNLVKFGAFVDLDGIEGLIHISQIAWQKVDRPAEFLRLGQEVEVQIQSVDVEKERISLSRKALLPSPWDLFAETHQVGDLTEGVITNVVDFGAFALISDGIEGLVHISELRGAQDFAPQDILTAGDTILLRILDIQPEQQRLALSQRRVSQSEETDWIWQRQQAITMNQEEEE